jgi:peptidoglycan/LPS O-acetylase OafA/YrhL
VTEPQDRPDPDAGRDAAAPPLRSEPRTLELIQVFRGMAALMVMLFHLTMTNHFYSPYLENVFGFGHSGVDFFFVLSGFVMLYAHWDQAGEVRRVWRFLALRAVRIYPIYWVVLAVTVATFWWHPPMRSLEPSVLRSAVLLSDPEVPIIPIAWTMTFELVFYAFFALYFVIGAWLFALLTIGWAAALAAQVTQIAYWPYPILLNPLVGEFLLGCLAAFLVKRLDRKHVSGWWIILVLTLCAAVAHAELIGAIDGYSHYALPYFLLIWAGAAYDHANRQRYPRLLVLIGEASYSIYLTHYGLIAVFAETVDYYRPTASVYPNLTLNLVAIAIVGVGILVHTRVERPILTAFRRRLR